MLPAVLIWMDSDALGVNWNHTARCVAKSMQAGMVGSSGEVVAAVALSVVL